MHELTGWARGWSTDVRHAVRSLWRAPAASAAFVATTALAIGINTALFHVVNASLFREPAGVQAFDRLVAADWPGVCRQGGCVSPPEWFGRVDRPLSTMSAIGGFGDRPVSVSAGGRSATLNVTGVWNDYFSALGVQPAQGRLLGGADDGVDAAVVSDVFWRTWLGGRDDAIGQTILVAGRPFVVVGIASPGFRGLFAANLIGTDVWIPWHALPDMPSSFLARLRPGVALGAAAAELQSLTKGLDPDDPDRFLDLEPLSAFVFDYPIEFYVMVAFVLGVPIVVLLIAAVNLTAVLLARFSGRMGEMATRVMLGATRGDILRLLGLEVFLLTSLGGTLGTWLAIAGTRLLPLPALGFWQLSVDLSPDVRPVALGVLLSVVAGIVVLRAVSSRVTTVDGLALLASNAGAGTASPESAPIRRRLIAGQTAAAVLLLVLAGLFVRSAVRGLAIDPSLDARHAAAASYDHDRQGHDDAETRTTDAAVLEVARRMPRVDHAALLTRLPTDAGSYVRLARDGVAARPLASRVGVTPEFADAVGLTIVRGRTFNEGERASDAAVVVSQSVADLLFPNMDPLGQPLRMADVAGRGPATTRIVVGVASEVGGGGRPGARRHVYVPLDQVSVPYRTLVVRGRATDGVLAADVARAVSASLPTLALFNIAPLSEHLGVYAVALEWGAGLLSILGAMGAMLAAVGLFGVVAHTTAMRRREFGIRRALGATNQGLLAAAARDGARTLVVGALPGLVLALLAAWTLRAYVPGFRAFDGIVFAGVPMAVVMVGVAACVLPVRTMLREAPLSALRDP